VNREPIAGVPLWLFVLLVTAGFAVGWFIGEITGLRGLMWRV
jgi:hypothetical protein